MSAQNISLLTLTLVAAGAVAANRFVTPGGAQAGNGANAIGGSRYAVALGDKFPVDAIGTAVIEAGAAFASGATLQSDANGKAITYAAGAKVAIALQAAGAAGELIEVLLVPNAA